VSRLIFYEFIFEALRYERKVYNIFRASYDLCRYFIRYYEYKRGFLGDIKKYIYYYVLYRSYKAALVGVIKVKVFYYYMVVYLFL